MTINGKEIKLQNGKIFPAPGAACLRCVLDLPIKASNKTGDKTRQVHIKALREQGKYNTWGQEKGYLALVLLHAHLPFIKHPEYPTFWKRTGFMKPWWKPTCRF